MTIAGPTRGDAIVFDGVGVRFGSKVALEAASFAIGGGRICAFCGPNGAGKSTTLRVVCGLLRPTSGSGRVLDESLHARPVRRRARIGYMAQREVLYDELSVTENLRFRAAAMGLREPRRRVVEAVLAHGLEAVAASRVAALSGGWRQRVAFAAALLADPRLLVLDEPMAGLDAVARRTLWAGLRSLAAGGVTVLISTHDAVEAASCDRLIVLEQNRVVFDGEPRTRWPARELEALVSAAATGMAAA